MDSRVGPRVDGSRFTLTVTATVLSASLLLLIVLVLLSKYKRRRPESDTPRPILLQNNPQYGAAYAASLASRNAALGATPQPNPRLAGPLHLHDPSPAYDQQDPFIARGNAVSAPTPAHLLSPPFDSDNDWAPVLGSVQRRIHPAIRQDTLEGRESVDTLPRYNDPPCYDSVAGPLDSAQRMD